MLFAIFTPENEHTEELRIGIHKNNVINCLGILFTAVVQTLQGTLDLYHAIVVMYILFFFNVVFVFGMYLRPAAIQLPFSRTDRKEGRREKICLV
jgi:hypothetical protein